VAIDILKHNLLLVSSSLDAQDVKYCIVGGFAVSYRAEPRLTRDIDITLSVTSDEEAEVIIRNISSTGLVAETVLENSVLGVISTVRLVNPSSSRKIYTDLLFRSCGIEEEIVKSATQEELFPRERTFPVATIPSLIAMKCLSYSPQLRSKDLDDLRGLLQQASRQQREESARLVKLIQDRGFARGEDLVAKLNQIYSQLVTPSD
jgi:hypothetical protein